jgi:glycogen debranching enzyme
MVLFARHLATIASALGKSEPAQSFTREADELARQINERMWDPEHQFYFDLTLAGKYAPVKTVAAFWTLLAGVASPAQMTALVGELNNPRTFKRLHRVPTLAADQAGYNPAGGYWCGSVWAPTTTMVIRGLERYGQRDLARELALNHLEVMGQVFHATGTIWENYAPDAAQPGRPAKADFVGWSGIGPILYLLEFAIGLKPDAPNNTLVWDLTSSRTIGCERFRFNSHVVTLKAEPVDGDAPGWVVAVNSDSAFQLRLRHRGQSQIHAVTPGQNRFQFSRQQAR